MSSWDPRALAVLERLEAAGHQAVFVGGCVRDLLRGQPPHDYDAATSALPEEILSACASLRCVPTGLKHGTVTVLSDGLPVEVTTFRREGRYTDHRHPDQVAFTCSLAEDLARRDFTINAMAWSPSGLSDPFGGREDLARGTIRCVGDGDRRFREDALRILRGLRLAAQLDFLLEEQTVAAIRRSAPLLQYVAWERISAELLRLLCGPGAGRVLLAFPEVIGQILPELVPAVGFLQYSPHHRFDVYTHSVKTLEGVRPEPALRLAALLHDTGKPSCFTLDPEGIGHFYGHEEESARLADCAARRLRLDRRTREQVVLLVGRHGLGLPLEERAVRRWLRRLGPESFLDLLELQRADGAACGVDKPDQEARRTRLEALARDILAQAPCLTIGDLAVNGRDALAAGLEGPAIGRALRALLEQVSQGELPNDRTVLLEHLKKN